MHTRRPFTLSTITYKAVVYAPAKRADILPLFLLYPYMYSVLTPFNFKYHALGGAKPMSPRKGGGKERGKGEGIRLLNFGVAPPPPPPTPHPHIPCR